jgi:VWFA-related protein
MTGRWLFLTGALMIGVVPRPIGAQEAQAPTTRFSSAVDVVSVTAVVRDRKGRFVRDLDKADFTVVEAGQARQILDFRAESDGPVKLALLVDVSGSMRVGNKTVGARQAASHIFSALRAQDEAAIYAFDSRLDRVSDFTSDVAVLEAALDRVQPPYGQTSLYDAVAETARAVAAEKSSTSGPLPQRRAVVVLTDGIDTRSQLTPAQVSGIASGIDVPVYVLAVMSTIDDPRNTIEGADEISSSLSNLAQWTGGDLFTASAPAHASIAARRIVDELRHQYVLAFEASTRPGWRPVEVRSRDRGHIVRARAGYTAGGEG